MKKNLFFLFSLLFVNTVFSQQDITPPELTNFSFVPDTIDVSSGSQIVNYTVGAKDDFEVYRILVQFISPDNQISRSDQKFPSQDTDSTVVSGSVTFLENDAEGQWSITLVLFDEIGNRRFIYSSDLEQLGLQSHIFIINEKEILLNKPNGGEILFADSTYNILWTSSGINNVNLEYSVDNGNNWIFIAQNVEASLKHYSWKVDNNPSINCILRISDSDNSQITDISDSLWVIESTVTQIKSNDIVTSYNLFQNYPNPFNPNTTIKFSLQKSCFVELEIYNSIGEMINLLVSEYLTHGFYEIKFNASSLSSGIYYYRILTNDFYQTKKMLLIK